jgi:hypothetical protein
VDLVHWLLEAGSSLSIQEARFYEAGSLDILTGFEVMATHKETGRDVTIDFLQDSLRHSAIQSRVLVGGTSSDAELRFYPSGFRMLSGVQDPLHELGGEFHRAWNLLRSTLRPSRRPRPHLKLARDLIEASARDGQPLISPESVRPSIEFLEQLSYLWRQPKNLGDGASHEKRTT